MNMNPPILPRLLIAFTCLGTGCSDSPSSDNDPSTSGGTGTTQGESGPVTLSSSGPGTDPLPGTDTAPATDTLLPSTGPDETTGDPPAECGDGIVDADEACDDGNAEDGDGCNVDCLRSGSVVWRWSSEAGLVSRIVAAPDDTVYAATVASSDGMTIVHLSADGDVLDEQPAVVPPALEDERRTALAITGITVVDGSPVVASDATFETAAGRFVRAVGTIERLGADGWVLSEDDRFSIAIDTTPDGDILGSDDSTFFSYTAGGDESWRNAGGGVRAVVATPMGQLVALDREQVVAFNNDGTEAWTLPIPSPNVLDGLRALSHAPEGGLWVMQEVVDGQSVLRNIDSAGVVGATIGVDAWPLLVVGDDDGHVFLRPSDTDGMFAKHDEALDRLWLTDLGGSNGDSVGFATLDGQGQAIVLTGDGEVIKLAP